MKTGIVTHSLLVLCALVFVTPSAIAQKRPDLTKVFNKSSKAAKAADVVRNSRAFRGAGAVSASSTYGNSPFARSASSNTPSIARQNQVSQQNFLNRQTNRNRARTPVQRPAPKPVQRKTPPVQLKRTPPKNKVSGGQPPKKTIAKPFNTVVTKPGKAQKVKAGTALAFLPSPKIGYKNVKNKTRGQVQDLAKRNGLRPFGQFEGGKPKKWKDPYTGVERLRLDRGHKNADGTPYRDKPAARDHLHLKDNRARPVKTRKGNPHIPTKK